MGSSDNIRSPGEIQGPSVVIFSKKRTQVLSVQCLCKFDSSSGSSRVVGQTINSVHETRVQ